MVISKQINNKQINIEINNDVKIAEVPIAFVETLDSGSVIRQNISLIKLSCFFEILENKPLLTLM